MPGTAERVKELVLQQYAFSADVEPLPGEVDLNFRIDCDGKRYVLKLARPGTGRTIIDLQNEVIAHLAASGKLVVPRVIPTGNGDLIGEVDYAGEKRLMRLLTWIDGRPVAAVRPHSAGLLYKWGRLCGKLCAALSGFDHPAAHRFIKWDPAGLPWIIDRLDDLPESRRGLVDYFLRMFDERVRPLSGFLRRSVSYNDANDHNVLATGAGEGVDIPGVIDFGDVVHTFTVNELAIACAYACMHKENPLDSAVQMVKGFHGAFLLQEAEVSALFPLIAARLLISVTCSAINRREEPDNVYLQISDQPAWALLEKLKGIPPSLAEYHFRHACGWEPVPGFSLWRKWVQDYDVSASRLTGFDLTASNVCWFDLSAGSGQLGHFENFVDPDRLEEHITAVLKENRASAGIGRYNEVRPLYTAAAFAVQGNNGPEWRTVHVGLDVFADVGTSVFALADGVIHSLADNDEERDYGPTVILSHPVSRDLTFFTLYGHLSRESLTRLRPGMSIKAGAEVGRIGSRSENGNWPPHLHFQVMLDDLGMQGNFSGVVNFRHRGIWEKLCPDPWLLIAGKNSPPSAVTAPSEILEKRREKLGRNLSVSYRSPLTMVRGFGQYLCDHSGRRYLDTVNNVAHVGHEHPRIVRAGQRQMAVLNTNTRYLHPTIVRFSEELLSTLPAPLEVAFMVNSGSEANELAMRLAKTFTGQRDMVVVQVGYHGNTNACVDISSYKFDGKGGTGAPEHVHVVPIPDAYRGLYRGSDAGVHYARHVAQAVQAIRQKGRGVAAFICESVLSCGGQVVLPEGYLKDAYAAVRKAGGLCIADEVQTGVGRAGDYFWAFEAQGVVPDIVAVGKPIGNGHPLGVVVTTRAIADAFANGMEFFSTFGGNPVSCAIGLEVLRVVREEGLQAHAKELGSYLTAGLIGLMEKFESIGDVRGPGLFIGFELVKNRTSLEPATAQADYLVNRMRECGILMSTDGPFNNVIKIKPPLVITRSDIDYLVSTLDKVLGEDSMAV